MIILILSITAWDSVSSLYVSLEELFLSNYYIYITYTNDIYIYKFFLSNKIVSQSLSNIQGGW